VSAIAGRKAPKLLGKAVSGSSASKYHIVAKPLAQPINNPNRTAVVSRSAACPDARLLRPNLLPVTNDWLPSAMRQAGDFVLLFGLHARLRCINTYRPNGPICQQQSWG
jgi:hypothetical protein